LLSSFVFQSDITIHLSEIESVYDALRFGGDSRFHVTDSIVPACLSENLSTEKTFRDQANKGIEPHDLCVPNAHDMKTPRVCWLQPQTLHRIIVDRRAVFHATSRTLS